MMASKYGKLEIVSTLLECKADVEAQSYVRNQIFIMLLMMMMMPVNFIIIININFCHHYYITSYISNVSIVTLYKVICTILICESSASSTVWYIDYHQHHLPSGILIIIWIITIEYYLLNVSSLSLL